MADTALPRLQVRALCCRLGKRHVLEGLTLPPLEPGQLVALLGPNGSGKSTLLRAIAGLVPAQVAELRVNMTDIRSWPAHKRARLLRYLPQSALPPARLTVMECLRASVAQQPLADDFQVSRDTRLLEVLEELHIAALATSYLDALSGGQRQLAALAQFLSNCPTLLLVDEPLTALDIDHQHLVMKRLRTLAHETGRLVIVILHDLNMALRYADRALILHQGTLVAASAPTEAFTPSLLRDVFGINATLYTVPGLTHPVLLTNDSP